LAYFCAGIAMPGGPTPEVEKQKRMLIVFSIIAIVYVLYWIAN
jgi:hypothetical protein